MNMIITLPYCILDPAKRDRESRTCRSSLILLAVNNWMKEMIVFLYSFNPFIRLMSNITHKRGRYFYFSEIQMEKKGRVQKTAPCMCATYAKFKYYWEYKNTALTSQKHKLRGWSVLIWSLLFILSATKDLARAASRPSAVSTSHSSHHLTTPQCDPH